MFAGDWRAAALEWFVFGVVVIWCVVALVLV
jgi:hypothetical protein